MFYAPISSFLKEKSIPRELNILRSKLKYRKFVPYNISEYLTPLALAIWIMDDGCKVGKGLKFSTNSFSYNECLILVKALNDNFNLKASVQSAGSNDQHVIYIWKESMNDLRNIVSPYIIPEMRYKII